MSKDIMNIYAKKQSPSKNPSVKKLHEEKKQIDKQEPASKLETTEPPKQEQEEK